MRVKKFNLRKRLFNWHMWAGIAFAIPVVLVSLTAILIAHKKGLGTKKVLIQAGWMPGYQMDQKNLAHYLDDIKAYSKKGDFQYYGTKVGVLELSDGGLRVLPGTEGKEVRDMAWADDRLLVATKYGIIASTSTSGKELIKGDFHGITQEGNLWIASQGKYGILTSSDGGSSWNQADKLSQTLPKEALNGISSQLDQSGQMEAVALEKLILDIHTGEAFFGEGAMWVWIDLIGLSLLLMTITGIWMWYKRKYGKTTKASAPLKAKISSPKPVMKPVLHTEKVGG